MYSRTIPAKLLVKFYPLLFPKNVTAKINICYMVCGRDEDGWMLIQRVRNVLHPFQLIRLINLVRSKYSLS
jgi:hypothetical protein